MRIYNDDKEFSRKCREIWDKIIELIGINNHIIYYGRFTKKIQALLLKIIIDMDIIKS